jgi:iron complex transport system permease protein
MAIQLPMHLIVPLLILLVSFVLSLGMGAVSLAPSQVVHVLSNALRGEVAGPDALVILQVRLPRVVLGLAVGAALAVSGAVMQGLFRNPLADPGLVGVSAGAALAAAATIVLGPILAMLLSIQLPAVTLPLAAFFGGLGTTLALYLISTKEGRTSITTMMLAGIALQALANALLGLLAYLSDDRQLRDITFWTLGSLGGASWEKVATALPFLLPSIFAMPVLAKGLNAFALGEAEAFHLGIRTQWLKGAAVILVAISVGASVATAGIISFVGIIVPHLCRFAFGADHRRLLPASALLGASLLSVADCIARTIVTPAELPISILTAVIGAPFFLWLLLRSLNGTAP